MGFRISWIGFETLDREAVLTRLGMTDTGESDESNDAPFSLAALPNGWTILFANDFNYASGARLAGLSQGTRLVACRVHEGVMYSSAAAYEDGAFVWSVAHDAQDDIRHLATEGAVPAGFDAIRARYLKQQDAEDAGDADVDHVFEVPLVLAYDLAGYKHDARDDDGDNAEFTALSAPAEVRQGWWSRLFGKRG